MTLIYYQNTGMVPLHPDFPYGLLASHELDNAPKLTDTVAGMLADMKMVPPAGLAAALSGLQFADELWERERSGEVGAVIQGYAGNDDRTNADSAAYASQTACFETIRPSQTRNFSTLADLPEQAAARIQEGVCGS